MAHPRWPHCSLCTPKRMCARHLRAAKTYALIVSRRKKEQPK